MRRAVTGLVLATSLGLFACSSDSVRVTPRSFNRPGTLAFVCFDANQHEFVPLETCRGQTDVEDSPIRLTALLTQTSRGEVAAVDLGEETVLDSDVRVPGYTFQRVVDVPSGITVRPSRPAFAYVSSFVGHAVQAVPTHRFRPDATGDSAEQIINLPSGPAHIVLSPDENDLFLAMPDVGSVVRLPLAEDGTVGAPEEIPLDAGAAIPDPVDLTTFMTLPPGATAGAYTKLCTVGALPPTPSARVAPREPTLPGDAPRPVQIAVDSASGAPGTYRLLVSDEAWPVIHVLEVSGGTVTVGAPLVVGVPTRALALSPTVPAAGTGAAASEPARYLYAIDAVDQSVLVTDYLDGSPTFGAVLPVSTGSGPVDRIEFNAGARALEVITPEAQGETCSQANQELLANAAPSRLRGVFLVAGLTDGTLRFVDIHDLDAPCRGGDCMDHTPATAVPNENDTEIFIARHRPRIGNFFLNTFELNGLPTFRFEGVPGRVFTDGLVDTERAPGLLPREAGCPATMAQVFPSLLGEGAGQGEPPLICALADPWELPPERWSATFEGEIPGAQGGLGRLSTEDPNLFVASDGNFCSRGVLGADNVPEVDTLPDGVLPEDVPEVDYEGDLLAITSALPDFMEEDPRCAAFVGDVEDRDDILLPIRWAGAVRGTDGEVRGALRLEESDLLSRVRDCFVELVGYEVHVGGAYAVTGVATGFLHRVVQDDSAGDGTGACTVDFAADPRLQGRARAGVPFENTLVAFTIRESEDGAVLPRGTHAEMTFQLSVGPTVLYALIRDNGEAGALPTTLRWNELDQRLYVVDSGLSRLFRFSFDPLDRLGAFE